MVLVSHDHSFVFLKTTKTAGTSAEMALEPFCAGPRHVVSEPTETLISKHGIVGYRGSNRPASRPGWQIWRKHPWRNHMPAHQVRHNLGRDTFDRYTKITVVRNPFDRLISLYLYRNRKSPDQARDFVQLRENFRDFLLNEKWSDDSGIITIKGRLVIDRALRKETLAQDLDKLVDDLNLDRAKISLPHTKSQAEIRKNIPVSDYYDPDTIDAVRRKMSWYFDSFGYPDTPPDGETVPTAQKETA